jgi:5'-nucleotidase
MKNVLVTNDDGIDSSGIRVLRETLETDFNVFVVAPDRERSAAGHSISLNDPIRLKVIEKGKVFAITGTPVDAVHLALLGVVDEPVDAVVSGINHGLNLGSDVFYSGTVSAAFQATTFGVPGVAISVDIEGDTVHFETAAEFAKKTLIKIEKSKMESTIILNINVPNRPLDRVEGVEITRLGQRAYNDRLIEREDPKKNRYFWIDGDLKPEEPLSGTDVHALEHDRISITPLQKDITAVEHIARLSRWRFDEL